LQDFAKQKDHSQTLLHKELLDQVIKLFRSESTSTLDLDYAVESVTNNQKRHASFNSKEHNLDCIETLTRIFPDSLKIVRTKNRSALKIKAKELENPFFRRTQILEHFESLQKENRDPLAN